MESGEAWDDPSEDLLFELLGDIEDGEEEFLIVTRLRDASNQTYAQVIRNGDGSCLLERRDGSRDKHYSATLRDLRDTHRALTAWSFELAGWLDAAPWKHVLV
jgi:hypothetical protein